MTNQQFDIRRALDDAILWSHANYPAVAINRYRDAVYEIQRLQREVASLTDMLGSTAHEPEAPARFAECDSCERLYANHMAGKRCHQMLVTGEICKGTIMTKL